MTATKQLYLSLLVVALVGTPAPVVAQNDWFPEQARNAAAQELTERMKAIEAGPEIGPEERLAAARRGIDDIASRLDSWGLDGLLERSPEIPALEFPPTDKAIPAAIGRWGGCSLGLYEQLAEDDEQLFYISLSNVSIMIVSAYLRDAYLSAGGTDEELKSYLTSPAFTDLETHMAQTPELRTEVNEQCGPPLTALHGR